MNWFESLFFSSSVAHSILIIAIVIAIGIILGKFRIFGISFGATWILFVGIIFSHFGLSIDREVMDFVRDFGLILFIFSLGLQVGPGFFSSFKSGGVKMNLMAFIIVALGVCATVAMSIITDTPMPTMVGVMSGAITNTPGLGAAQQTLTEITGSTDPTLATGYAVAYPIGVIGVILTLIAARAAFRVDIKKEQDAIAKRNQIKDSAFKLAVEVNNEAICGKSIRDIDHIIGRNFVVSRQYLTSGHMDIPTSDSIINKGDKLLIITSTANADAIIAFLGKKIDMDQKEWEKLDTNLVSRRLVVTRSAINGKTLGELNIRAQFGINITRVNRAGIDLTARPDLELQLGDRVMVVGSEKAIAKVADLLGNSAKKLREPNLIPLFLGIFIGIIVGSLPIMLPGLSQPLKLGIAGGPLIIAIIIARFGHKVGMVTYTTMSSNMMLREIGIALFLGAVGLGAGDGFVDAIVGGGYMWILYGAVITIAPIIIAALIARFAFKMDYFSIAGIICGSHTNPPALAFMNSSYDESQIAVAYATVYPLAMFLRVIVAQLLVL